MMMILMKTICNFAIMKRQMFFTGRVMQAEVHRCLLVQSLQSIDLETDSQLIDLTDLHSIDLETDSQLIDLVDVDIK